MTTDQKPPFSIFTFIEQGPDALEDEPLGDGVFVLPLMSDVHPKGQRIQIADPNEQRGNSQRGVVLALGKGLYDPERQRVLPVRVQVGDIVSFGRFAGEAFELAQDLQVLIMRDTEIKSRRAWGTVTLIEHTRHAGTAQARHVYHRDTEECSFCTPAVVETPALDAERAAAERKHAEALGLDADIDAERARAKSPIALTDQ